MPLWFDMEPVYIISQWCDDWSSAAVVICDSPGPYYLSSRIRSAKETVVYFKSLQNKPRTLPAASSRAWLIATYVRVVPLGQCPT